MSATESGFAKVRAADSGSANAKIDYGPMVAELNVAFNSGKTKDLEWRRTQLKAIKSLFLENHEELTKALIADHGGPKVRGALDQLSAFGACDEYLANLDSWTSPQKVPTPFTVSPTRMAKSYVSPVPKGVILIIGPWNFPYGLIMEPLAAAVAAGNCVVIKPSEVAVNSGKVITKLINKYLDNSCVKVVEGAVAETTALLKENWDHIFYTGNGHIGRIVATAAAQHLTPVTLELGGKSPVIVDKSANMQSVVERISANKWGLNAGQICIAPDFVLIDKSREDEFITSCTAHVEKLFGKDPKTSEKYARVINDRHVNRIANLLKETKGKVVFGGMETVDPQAHFFPPTLVRNAQLGEPLLTEEIFGPVLPVIATENIEEAVKKANSVCDRPLALYVFAEDQNVTNYVMKNTTSGGCSINTCLEQVTNPNLPFGGVGGSGYGAYHGKAGFDEFTHRRACFQQDTTIMKGAAALPEYDVLIKLAMTGFLSPAQKKIGKGAAAVVGLAVLVKLFGPFRSVAIAVLKQALAMLGA